MLTTSQKQKLVEKFGDSSKDTGTTEVQVAILSKEIKLLTEHFSVNKKDNHSKRGLYAKIAKRASLLKYLRSKDYNRYETILKELQIRPLKS